MRWDNPPTYSTQMKGGSLLCGFKLGLIPRILHGGWRGWGRQWRACCLCKEATTYYYYNYYYSSLSIARKTARATELKKKQDEFERAALFSFLNLFDETNGGVRCSIGRRRRNNPDIKSLLWLHTRREEKKGRHTQWAKAKSNLSFFCTRHALFSFAFFRLHHHPNGAPPHRKHISWLLMMKTAEESSIQLVLGYYTKQQQQQEKLARTSLFFFLFNINRGRQMPSTNGVTEGLCCVLSTRFCFSLKGENNTVAVAVLNPV